MVDHEHRESKVAAHPPWVRRADETLLRDLCAAIEDELADAVDLRRRLHATPELGHQETETRQLVADAMPVAGTEVSNGGTVFAPDDAPASPIIGVRAELDGLEMEEQTGSGIASTNGNMHACGHDVHLAALVALTRAIVRVSRPDGPSLLAICQASEERPPSGALRMLDDVAFTKKLDAVVAAHVHPNLPWGGVGIEPGVVNAAADEMRITVTGESGHAAYPHRHRDPIPALGAIIGAVHMIVGRRVDPMRPLTITVGTLRAGTAANVIAATAEATGTIRSYDTGDQAMLRAAVEDAVAHIARAHGCEGVVEFPKNEPPLDNDRAVATAARRLADAAGLSVAEPWRSCGADDFAHFGRVAPSLMAFVGLRGAPGFTDTTLHSSRFLPPQEAVRQVSRAQALAFVAAGAASRR